MVETLRVDRARWHTLCMAETVKEKFDQILAGQRALDAKISELEQGVTAVASLLAEALKAIKARDAQGSPDVSAGLAVIERVMSMQAVLAPAPVSEAKEETLVDALKELAALKDLGNLFGGDDAS